MNPAKKFRLAEVFGPTVQGEGRNIGTPCYFIRLGGCDSRCGWCDTPHAVLPELVAKLVQKSAGEIYLELKEKTRPTRTADWVVLTGGNPALFDLLPLINILHGDRYSVMVETQGTVYKDWLQFVDDLCVSPKPPSSGNMLEQDALLEFMAPFKMIRIGYSEHVYLKVVVFDDEDYDYAKKVRNWLPEVEMFLSVGNADLSLPTVGNPTPESGRGIEYDGDMIRLRDELSTAYKKLIEKCLQDAAMRNVRVFPQLHVLAWGNVRGH